MKSDVFISVVIPAYNEEINIVSTINEVSEYFSSNTYNFEIIVVDDGSSDRTVELVKNCIREKSNLFLLESKPNRGKGYVVKKAMLEASGKYIMFMDADNSTSIKELDKFLPCFKDGYQAVIGSRRLKESEVTVPESALRIFMGNVYILLSRIILGARVRDFNCGFKVFSYDAAKRVFSLQKMNDWSFDTEIIFLLQKNNMRVKEVPVRWAHKDTSKVKPLSAGIKSFVSLIKILWNDLKGRYS